jgi:alkylhydroperoxidase/carboxymuconolactone decarboxylase family protein YurZ
MATEPEQAPILTLLATMTAASLEASSLDAETLMLVRIAALVAVDAPAVSYLLNLGAAGEIGVDEDQVQGVLAAVASIVGTPRVVAAATHMMQALDLKLDLEALQLDD